MTDEEIIEMALQAGFNQNVEYFANGLRQRLLDLARLVAARQREIDTGICLGMGKAKQPHADICDYRRAASAIREQGK